MMANRRHALARRRVLLVTAAALAVLLASCTSQPPREAVDDVREPLRALLRQRARLLLAGDVEGYLRPMSPAARRAEEPIARGAVVVRLRSLDFVVGASDAGAGGALDNVEVDFIYRYQGLPDDNAFRFQRIYRVQRRGGSLVVADSRPSSDPLLQAPIWTTGPVEVARSPHFLALSRPGLTAVEATLGLAERARSHLLPKLTLQPDAVHLVLLAGSDAEFAEFTSEDRTEPAPRADDSISLAFARSVDRGRGPEARDLVANLSAIGGAARLSFEGRGGVTPEEVFQHELGHLALLRFNGEDTPGWVIEGAAMYLSGEHRIDEWRNDVQKGFAGPSLVQLNGEENLAGQSYGYVNAAVLYLVETYGVATFWDFYQGVRTSGTDRLLRLLYKTDAVQLDDQVQAWMKRQTG